MQDNSRLRSWRRYEYSCRLLFFLVVIIGIFNIWWESSSNQCKSISDIVPNCYQPFLIHPVTDNVTKINELQIPGAHNLGSSSESDTYWFARNQIHDTPTILRILAPFQTFAISINIDWYNGDVVLNHGNLHNDDPVLGSTSTYSLGMFFKHVMEYLFDHPDSFVFIEINLDTRDAKSQARTHSYIKTLLGSITYSYRDWSNDNFEWPTLHEMVMVRNKQLCFLTYGLGDYTEYVMPKSWITPPFFIYSEDRTWVGHGIGSSMPSFVFGLNTVSNSHQKHVNPLISGPLRDRSYVSETNMPILILLDQLTVFDPRLMKDSWCAPFYPGIDILGGFVYRETSVRSRVYAARTTTTQQDKDIQSVIPTSNSHDLSNFFLGMFVTIVSLACIQHDIYGHGALLYGMFGWYSIGVFFPNLAVKMSVSILFFVFIRLGINFYVAIHLETQQNSLRRYPIVEYLYQINKIGQFELPIHRYIVEEDENENQQASGTTPRTIPILFSLLLSMVITTLVILRANVLTKTSPSIIVTFMSIVLLTLFLTRCVVWMIYLFMKQKLDILSYLVTCFQFCIVFYCWWTIYAVPISLLGAIISVCFLLLFLSLLIYRKWKQRTIRVSDLNQPLIEMQQSQSRT